MLTTEKRRWDSSAEVLVLGYGLAGAVAAISAHDSGAKVIILEKQPADSHCTCSSLSGGFFLSPSDIGKAAEHMTALCRCEGYPLGWTDRATIRAWAERISENKDWLTRLGGSVQFLRNWPEHGQLPGADSMAVWRYQGSGLRMMQFMYDQVASRKITVHYNTAARRLVIDGDGRVTGVLAGAAGNEEQAGMAVKASKAVIICSGGFEDDEEMKLQYLRMYPVYFSGGKGNTGDGIRMAQQAGADLWHMNCLSARLVAKFPDFDLAFSIDFGGSKWSLRQGHGDEKEACAGFIVVDKHGRRYMSENLKMHAAFYELTSFDTHHLEYPRVPSYHIFDRRRMELGSLALTLSGAAGPHQLYKWSPDNSAELEKGWILSGRTVADLAGRIGMPAATLEGTVRTWNEHCRTGSDPDFGRHVSDMVPLDNPPFYAVRLFPGGPSTEGGPRRNALAQVVDPFGKPISGLYSAGECGSVYGMLYPAAGGNLAECIAFGRIAAENAVRETVKGA